MTWLTMEFNDEMCSKELHEKKEEKKEMLKKKDRELSVFFTNLLLEILSNQRREWTIAARKSSPALMILLETN